MCRYVFQLLKTRILYSSRKRDVEGSVFFRSPIRLLQYRGRLACRPHHHFRIMNVVFDHLVGSFSRQRRRCTHRDAIVIPCIINNLIL